MLARAPAEGRGCGVNATSARFVRVAHVVTWTVRDGAHEEAVNTRLADLRGVVLSVAHSANLTETPEGENYQFSTLITYHDTSGCLVEDEDGN